MFSNDMGPMNITHNPTCRALRLNFHSMFHHGSCPLRTFPPPPHSVCCIFWKSLEFIAACVHIILEKQSRPYLTETLRRVSVLSLLPDLEFGLCPVWLVE